MTRARSIDEIPLSAVPPGAWAVGVSGGADSVALLALLRQRDDLKLHVAHLDHETRAGASGQDSEFVRQLAANWAIACTIHRRSAIEPRLGDLPANLPARFRRVRLEFFQEVVTSQQLDGVILAHHADDQAETILQRLLRGSSPAGLTGMAADSSIGSLRVLRPLLDARHDDLKQHLARQQIAWREDASNESNEYQRNRVRRMLRGSPRIFDEMIGLGTACREMVAWTRSESPRLEETFSVRELQRLPLPIAREAARDWLLKRLGENADLTPAAIERLVTMCLDAASAPRQQFSGGVQVRRRAGIISAGPSKVA